MKFGLLIVVAVAVLLPGSAEGRIASRCEVRDQLRKMPGKVDDKILATVICELEKRSHLNTSLVTMFDKHMAATPKPTGITTPSPTRVDKMTPEAQTSKPTSTSSATTKLTNATGSTSMHPTKVPPNGHNVTSSMGPTKVPPNGHDVTVKPSTQSLYGLFQLSDTQFCDSGSHLSTNLCQISCTSLTDDDITDDTACVIKTGFWRMIEKEASASCRTTKNFFKKCK